MNIKEQIEELKKQRELVQKERQDRLELQEQKKELNKEMDLLETSIKQSKDEGENNYNHKLRIAKQKIIGIKESKNIAKLGSMFTKLLDKLDNSLKVEKKEKKK